MTESDPFGSKKNFSRFFWNRPFCTEDDRKNLKKKFFDRRGPKGNFFQNFFFEFCGQDGWKFCEKYDMEFKLKNRMNVISLQYHTVPCLNDQWRHHRESPSRVTSPSHVTSPSRAIPYGRVLSPSSKILKTKNVLWISLYRFNSFDVELGSKINSWIKNVCDRLMVWDW